MIEVKVNNKSHQFNSSLSLTEMLSQLTIATNGIAVANNSEVIPKAKWDSFKLQGGENLIIIKATQGG